MGYPWDMNTYTRHMGLGGRMVLCAAVLAFLALAPGCGGSKPAPGYQAACKGSAIQTVVLDGFSQQQAEIVGRALTDMRCFGSLNVKSGAVNTATHHEYLYSTGLDSGELARALKKTLADNNMDASVSTGDKSVVLTLTPAVKVRRATDQ